MKIPKVEARLKITPFKTSVREQIQTSHDLIDIAQQLLNISRSTELQKDELSGIAEKLNQISDQIAEASRHISRSAKMSANELTRFIQKLSELDKEMAKIEDD